jgi:hypothetical protein
MFVLCVLYNKDKRQSQDKQNKAQREIKKIQVGTRLSAPVQTGRGAKQTSYTMGIGYFLAGKAPEEWL